MARPKTWALVTNGVRARILRDLEESEAQEPVEIVSTSTSPHLREIMSDRAGRSFASDASGRRSAMEPGSDPILRDIQDFAQETLDLLAARHHARELTRLAIFAAPKMLGILRRQMPASLREAVFLERDLNLINLSAAELRETVTKTMREGPT